MLLKMKLHFVLVLLKITLYISLKKISPKMRAYFENIIQTIYNCPYT